MTAGSPDEYFVQIDDTLVGRKAGTGAAEKAKQAREAAPLRTFVARIFGQHTDERAWRRGADGERFVGWLLSRLPDGWHVFNDVPVGERGANIDHVVIGPGGVFTINTKNISGKVLAGSRALLRNGRRTDYLPKAAHEARRAGRLLTEALGRPVRVHGTLAIIADEVKIEQQPSDVFVGTPRGVKAWMLDRPPVLTPRDVIEIAGVAHKPATWSSARH